jgi:methylated-DNA-protein-cysteine methyltransferase-like protein
MGDVADLTAKAYDIARMIPVGHITTYGQLTHIYLDESDVIGHIAKLAGYPTYSRYSLHSAGADVRHVGNAMKMLPTTTDIPWQVRPERQ